jgi:hypothetical protein
MRCRKCNVDLAESYTICPLCGEKASDDAALLEGFTVAPYPKNSPVKPISEEDKPSYGLSKEKLKAFFNI